MINLLPYSVVGIPIDIRKEIEKIYPTPYLFGSRYMSQFWPYELRAEDSDWDFAFPYSGSEQQEVELLESLGWKHKPSHKYRDDLHFMTWEKQVGKDKVQMCSKINLSFFKQTWETLDPIFYWDFLHKSSKQQLSKEVQVSLFNQLYKTKG